MQYYHASKSRISPYFTMFLMFHNIVHLLYSTSLQMLPVKLDPRLARATQTAKSRSVNMSDSLNISPLARWVVCPQPAGRTRGHGPGIKSPADSRIQQRKLKVVLAVSLLYGR